MLGGLVWWTLSKSEQSASRKRIALSELELIDFGLGKSIISFLSHEIGGRIRNKSPRYTLERLALKITINDCVQDLHSEKERCDIVAQSDEVISVNIPPGQARDFKQGVGLPYVRGKMTWYYTVSYLEAR